jgi:actin-like ATPase involved in cell morphogenesis
MAIGFDVGSFNLVSCKRNDAGDLVCKRQVNAFIEIKLDNDFTYNMMEKAGVPLIRRDDVKIAYAAGEKALNFAYTMPGIEIRRPMKDGCVNPSESQSFEILNRMIHTLLDNVTKDQEVLYYCVPANAINVKTDADYHQKVLDAIFKAYRSKQGYTVLARPLNEGLALVYAELADKGWTGIGVSFGAGMVNVSCAIFSNPIFNFSLVNSGDWIDQQAAAALNESVAFVNKAKMSIDLTKEPTNMVERAISTQYRIMIEKTVAGIKKGMEENRSNIQEPMDMVVAGGTSSPNGFEQLFREVIDLAKLPVAINQIIKPAEPLFSVAKGCLVAAENSN